MSAQPALFSDAPGARRKFAASWSADERQFAAWLMKTWNETVGVAGQKAYNKRPNHFAAIQLYRRMWALHPARAEMGLPARQLFSNEAIRVALAAYAACEHNVKLKSWKCFHDWCDLGEELIDKHLKRIGWEEPPPPNPKREAAEKLLADCPYIAIAASATKANMALAEFLNYEAARYVMIKMRSEDERRRILSSIHSVAAKVQKIRNRQIEAQRDLWKRAADLFADWSGRPMGRSLTDTNAGRAIAIALVDRDENPQPKQEPAS